MAKRRTAPDVAKAAFDTGVLDELVGYRVKRANLRLSADLVRSLEPLALRPVTFSVLATVDSNPGLSQGALGDRLAIKRANFVAIALELEERGWIVRTAGRIDRRQYVVDLTQDGSARLRQAWAVVHEHERRMLTGVSTRDRKRLFALLRHLALDDLVGSASETDTTAETVSAARKLTSKPRSGVTRAAAGPVVGGARTARRRRGRAIRTRARTIPR